MLTTMKPLFLAALLASAGVSYAQEAAEAPADAATDTTTTEQAPAEAPAETQSADPAADLSLGEPVVGQPYILEEFGDWAMRCIKAPEDQKDPCQLYQLLNDADGNSVAEFSMFILPAGSRAAAGATVVVPLETYLPEQLTLAVDGTAARRYPLTFCNRAGCVAKIGFTSEEVNQFKRGAKATLRMVPAAAPDQEVILDISLDGFTAGITGVVNAGQ